MGESVTVTAIGKDEHGNEAIEDSHTGVSFLALGIVTLDRTVTLVRGRATFIFTSKLAGDVVVAATVGASGAEPVSVSFLSGSLLQLLNFTA